MQAVPLAGSKLFQILPARGTRPNESIYMGMYSWKSDSKEHKTNLEHRKSKM